MTKDEIRKHILNQRNALSAFEINEKSDIIFKKLLKTQEYQEAENVLIYVSMGSEVRTDEIILDSLSRGKKVFCPKCTDTSNGIMEFVRIYDITDLKDSYYGIREPEISSESELFESKDFDHVVLIMPLVAFDDENNRIGYKGGYYDRFLARFPELIERSFALAFEVQRSAERIPTEAYDVKFKNIVTDIADS